jgi:hypothetical protein
VVTAVVILVVFFVGVAVLFVVLSRPRVPDRRWGRPREDHWGDWMRRHHLSAGEAGDISNGVTRGRPYTDPRLRAAAVAWAGTILRTEFSGRATALLIGLYLVPVVVTIVLQPHDVNWLLVVMWAAFAAVILRRRRGVRRSMEINQD